jgi:hypothetical protein
MTFRFLLMMLAGAFLAGAGLAQSGEWTNHSGFEAREGHAVLEFNGRMWLFGGRGTSNAPLNDVWSSSDGANWTLETQSAAWPARSHFAAAVFDGRMWVTGGLGAGNLDDVWSSPDGINWTLELQSAPWGKRYGHTVTSYRGELWLTGGTFNYAPTNDIWRSPDGVSWTQDPTPPWPGRSEHAAVEHNNLLFIMGGQAESWLFLQDVWAWDPVNTTWSWQTDTAWDGSSHPGRKGFGAVTFGGELWVVGGIHGLSPIGPHGSTSEVWRSIDDGISWTVDTGATDRGYHSALVFNNRLWVLGGRADLWNGGIFYAGNPGSVVNDVWSTVDGVTWNEATSNGGFDGWPGRDGHASLVFNNRLWVLGGASKTDVSPNGGRLTSYPITLGDVWSSPDGATWQQDRSSAWPTRSGHAVAVFNGAMWVLGGNSYGIQPLDDIWSSVDGTNWSQAAVAGQHWTAREDHATVVFQNKLWVIGGRDGAGYRNDVWSTPDGINWTRETPAAGWIPRAGHTATVFDNRIWVIGGGDGNGVVTGGIQRDSAFGDIWSSQDGINWTLETANAPCGQRRDHACAVAYGRIWLAGGGDPGVYPWVRRDLWSSPDGVNWTPEPTDAPWSGRIRHNLDTFNGELWMTGGRGSSGQQHDTFRGLAEAWSFAVAPEFTSTPVTTATAGSLYTYDITAEGTPAITFAAPGLPAWLQLNGSTLSGVPTANDVGLSGIITVTATNGGGTAAQTYQIDVAGVPPSITSTPATTATAGVPYAYNVTAVGPAPGPILSAAGLPAWLAFDPMTGVLAGTPGGGHIGLTGVITITASNGTPPDAVQSFQIDVLGTPAQIVTPPVTGAVEGRLYQYLPGTLGLPAASWSSGPLPAWLSLDPGTGLLSGTPPLGAEATVSISITADNGWGSDTQQFALNVLEDVSAGGGNSDAGCTAGAGASAWLLFALLAWLSLRRRIRRRGVSV